MEGYDNPTGLIPLTVLPQIRKEKPTDLSQHDTAQNIETSMVNEQGRGLIGQTLPKIQHGPYLSQHVLKQNLKQLTLKQTIGQLNLKAMIPYTVRVTF